MRPFHSGFQKPLTSSLNLIMGKISLYLKKISIICRSEDVPQDGQRIIASIEANSDLEKNLIFEVTPISSKETRNDSNDDLIEYRKQLIEIEQKVGDSFLKTLLTLSGGALGLSLAFIKDIIGDDPIQNSKALIISWSLLTLSLASILVSLYLGIIAYRCAINQIDKCTIYQQSPGGKCAKLMPIFNCLSICTFIAGLVFLLVFTYMNIGG